MNLAAVAPGWLVWITVALLLIAAIEDAWRLRISNAVSAGVLATAVVAAIGWGLNPPLWQNLVLFGAVLVTGTGLFSAGWFGGGDVKLFAAIALWFSLAGALILVPAILIAGGLVALVAIVGRIIARKVKGATDAHSAKSRKSHRIPYGVAIAAGAAFALFQVTQQQSAHDKTFGFSPDRLKPVPTTVTTLSPNG